MADHPNPLRHYAPRIGIALAATVLAMLPFELWARAQFAKNNATFGDLADRAPANTADLKLGDLIEPSAFDDAVYDLRPSIHGVFHGQAYKANSRGMRDHEIDDEKKPGELRVALLGDSFAFGWGVRADESFAEVVERGLANRFPGRSIEVMNFGVPGYNSAQEAACLEHKAIDLKPDAIVLQYYYNDRFLPIFLLEKKETPAFCLGEILRSHFVTHEPIAAALSMPEGEGGEADSVVAEWKADESRVPPKYAHMVGYEGVARAFERIHTIAAAHHIPVLVVAIAQPTQRMVESDQEFPADRVGDPKIQELAQRNGFKFVDTLSTVTNSLRRRQMKLSDVLISAGDWHFNVQGNQLVGGWLVDHVAALLPSEQTAR